MTALRQTSPFTSPPGPRLAAALALLFTALSLAPAAPPDPATTLSPEEKRQGFQLLFDGQSLDGWEQKGNWVAEDGALYRKEKGGDITWKTAPVPDNFELRFEWKVSKGCNSGVYYRPGQYEYQVLDNAHSPYGENPRQSAASLFFCMAPSKDATRPYGSWNEGRIVCQGTVIQHWLNGECVLDFDYTDPRWAEEVNLLKIRGANLAARGAHLRLQDHGADVWYRHLCLRTLPAEEKLVRTAFQPMPVPPAALKKEQERVQQMLRRTPPPAPKAPPATSKTSGPPVKIIFDTDMHTDCDDAGALAVLHALADREECEILAIMGSTLDPWSIPAIDVINTYYGRPDLPLGTVKGNGVLRSSRYTEGLAEKFPHDLRTSADAQDAVSLYRDILEQQPDHSVVIVTVGYLTNVSNLLRLPAQDGRPSGLTLVQQKVRTWVCMGGNFIGQPPRDDLKLGNVNFTYDAPAAHHAIHTWPGDLDFAGREVCSVPSGLALGTCLAAAPATHPVRAAYELYFGGQLKDRHVADLVAVLYAVRGLRDYWDLSPPGRMDLQPDMTFTWNPSPAPLANNSPAPRQAYLKKKLLQGRPNDRYVETVLEELIMAERRQ
jgi:hypothetical protein